jgi:hypothetical protein
MRPNIDPARLSCQQSRATFLILLSAFHISTWLSYIACNIMLHATTLYGTTLAHDDCLLHRACCFPRNMSSFLQFTSKLLLFTTTSSTHHMYRRTNRICRHAGTRRSFKSWTHLILLSAFGRHPKIKDVRVKVRKHPSSNHTSSQQSVSPRRASI